MCIIIIITMKILKMCNVSDVCTVHFRTKNDNSNDDNNSVLFSQTATKAPPGVPLSAATTSVNAAAGKLRFRLLAEHVILYCGSQRGTLDQVSLALFPACFVLFAVAYWISYAAESDRRKPSDNV